MAHAHPPTSAAELSSRKLVTGWPAAPRVRIRLAAAGDVDTVADLIALTDVPREDTMMDALEQEIVGEALRAGLDRGIPALYHAVAEHSQSGGLKGSYLRASLCLVADHRDHGIVGTLLAYPPINVVGDIINATQGMIDRQQAFKIGLLGAVALTKIKAVAVAEPARGQHIGGSLLTRCKQIYLHLGYKLVYGQMPANPSLETFYRRHGFDVLAPGEGLDLSHLFGIPSRLSSGPDHQVFTHWQLTQP